MQQNMYNNLPDLSLGHTLVVGDLMLDRYWFGDTARISPEAPVPVVKIQQINNRPGGAGNVALNIAALSCQTTLLGITGADEAGATLRDQLEASNVTHDLLACTTESTIVKLRVVSQHQQLIRLDFEEQQFTSNNQEKLIERFQKQLAKSNLVILSDYNKGTLQNPAKLIQLAKTAKVPVLVDPKGNDFSIYQGADIITPNLKEFENIVGHCSNEEELIQKGRQLMTDCEFKSLLVTRGADGMTLIQADQMTHFPAFAREVFDVTGAGDTVIGTLGACIAAGCDIVTAVRIANQAAGLVVNKLGAATISAPELDVALSQNTKLDCGIVNQEQLKLAVNQARSNGKRIIFTNGCFDILHAGHVTYLNQAKTLGDFLIVAINTDESIKRLKGPNRPINNLEHRMTVLAGLEAVDWVVAFDDDTPEALLEMIRPDILVKGTDYNIDQVVGADIVKSYGGEVRIISHNITTSSTKIFLKTQEA